MILGSVAAKRKAARKNIRLTKCRLYSFYDFNPDMPSQVYIRKMKTAAWVVSNLMSKIYEFKLARP